ncbi:hypothetical protein ACHAXT_000154 [Thalassiosira profunda]
MNRLLHAASRSAAASLAPSGSHRASNVFSSSASLRYLARPFSDVADSSTTEPISPTDDAEIKVGTVKHVEYNKNWSLIVPDGIDFNNHDRSELVFAHGSGIKKDDDAGESNRQFNGRHIYRGLRVQYRISPSEAEGRSNQAYDLTLEGGALLEPYQRKPKMDEVFVKKQHRLLGEAVMEIFDSSGDAKELEDRLVEAYERAKDNINRNATGQPQKKGGDGGISGESNG